MKPCVKAKNPDLHSCIRCKHFPWDKKRIQLEGGIPRSLRHVPVKSCPDGVYRVWTRCAPFYKNDCPYFEEDKKGDMVGEGEKAA